VDQTREQWIRQRAPYVGDRVLDLSRAGSRAWGYNSQAEVTVEVLVPAEPAAASVD